MSSIFVVTRNFTPVEGEEHESWNEPYLEVAFSSREIADSYVKEQEVLQAEALKTASPEQIERKIYEDTLTITVVELLDFWEPVTENFS